MAVTVVKDAKKAAKKLKKATKIKVAGIVEKLNALGDAYIEMHPVSEKLKGLTKAWKPLFSEVQDFVDEDNARDKEVILKSDRYAATFTAHGNMAACTDAKLAYNMLNKVQKGLGIELMSFPVGELKKYLTPAQMDRVVTMTRSKARSVKVIKLDAE